MAFTCVMYSPDLAQWKCEVWPGRTITVPGGVRLQLFSIELIAEANVKDAGNHGVYPILGVFVWHQLNGARHLHPDDVRAFVRRVTHNNGEAHRRRERREWLPVDILRSDRLENSLPWLMRSHSSSIQWFRADCGLIACHRQVSA
jgi:hypothetical protein